MKLTKYKLSIFLLLIVLPIITLAAPIDSGLDTAAREANFPMGEDADVYVVVGRWINGFLGAFMMFFTYFLVSAGFNWMTSGGNPEKVLAAKTSIKNALIGISIAFLAYILTRTVMMALGNATGVAIPQ
ncbi:MAG: hypothetical protein WCS88_02430 [Patescibacteria group bacterium]|jgi:hypothetical protein